MDEYLFITLAKLNADRRRLEREHREELRLAPPSHSTRQRDPHAGFSTWFSPEPTLRRTES